MSNQTKHTQSLCDDSGSTPRKCAQVSKDYWSLKSSVSIHIILFGWRSGSDLIITGTCPLIQDSFIQNFHLCDSEITNYRTVQVKWHASIHTNRHKRGGAWAGLSTSPRMVLKVGETYTMKLKRHQAWGVLVWLNWRIKVCLDCIKYCLKPP